MSVELQVLNMDKIDNATEVVVYSPATSAPAQAAVVKGMRFANVSGVEAVLNVYFVPEGGTFASDKRHLFPKDLKVSPGGAAVDDQEVTLGSGDTIYAKVEDLGAVGAPWFEYVASGVERDE